MNDQNQTTENSGPPPLVVAEQIDQALPAAWARVAEYLDAFGTPSGGDPGTLGRRKAADDRISVLNAADLRTILDALETTITATAGPTECACHDVYYLNDGELRTKVIRLGAVAISAKAPRSEAGPGEYERAVAAAIDAVQPILTRVIEQANTHIAQGECGDHSPTCHGYQAAERIALAISRGLDTEEIDGERTACGPTLHLEGDALDDIRAKLGRLLEISEPNEPTDTTKETDR